MNVRAVAARTLAPVLEMKQSLATALTPTLSDVPLRDRGLLQELCYGVCRWHPQLQRLLSHLLSRPLASSEYAIHALLLIGLYQLWHLRIPQHAAVAETVAAARQLRKPWAAALINAVLRTSLRRHPELQKLVEQDEEAHTAHPRWLLQRLQQDWPQAWLMMTAANNAHPPFTLRINLSHFEKVYPQLQCVAMSESLRTIALPATALTLAEPRDVSTVYGFKEGWISVQDAAAQLAAPLLDLRPKQRVLDACAAPGGKTGHLLEMEPNIELTALDQDARRLAQVKDNLRRLRLNARLITGDARCPTDWWDGILYDRILVDAPCSGTGVIRRHPDIKLLRRDSDIPQLAEQQQLILTRLWPLLQPGGQLLYATCSVLRQENEQVINTFLAHHPDAQEQPIVASWGQALSHGRQILPGEGNMDGFYYACLSKRLGLTGA